MVSFLGETNDLAAMLDCWLGDLPESVGFFFCEESAYGHAEVCFQDFDTLDNIFFFLSDGEVALGRDFDVVSAVVSDEVDIP